MTSKRIFAVVFAALTVLSGAVAGVAVTGSAQAAPQDISSCTVIDEAGEYRLTNDVGESSPADDSLSGEACLEIAAENVTLDGNGHTVAGDGGYGVYARSDTIATLTDLTVSGWETGVYLDRNSDLALQRVTAENNDVGVETFVAAVTVEDSTVTDNAVGIRLGESSASSITDSDVSNNDGVGINADNTDLTVQQSTVTNNGGDGVLADRDMTLTVDGSVVADNGGLGINAEGSETTVAATGNFWGASDGPSSETSEPLEDPETGTLADGSGDAVSEGSEAGVSNVRFDASLAENPLADDGDSDAGDGDDSDDSDTTAISSCMVIDEAGDYELTNDITNESTDECLSVTADDVTVDGNGYTIDGVDGSGTGVFVGTGTVTDLTVRGFEYGFETYSGGVMQNVTATENVVGIYLGQSLGGYVYDSHIVDNEENGIFASIATEDKDPLAISGNVIEDTQSGSGIYAFVSDLVVEDNVLQNNAGAGFSGQDASVTFADNTVRENDESGVALSASYATMDGDSVVNNGDTGVATYGTLDATNVEIRDNGGDGVYVAGAPSYYGNGSVVLTDSVVADNDGDGINADSFSDVMAHGSVIADNANLGVNNSDGVANATGNFWGASDGPSSETTDALEDPGTGTLADGSGDAVSEGSETGISNVRFDAFLTENPLTDDGDSGADDGDDSDDSDDSDESGDSDDSEESDDSDDSNEDESGADDGDDSDDSQDSDDSDDSDESDESDDSDSTDDSDDSEDSNDSDESDESDDSDEPNDSDESSDADDSESGDDANADGSAYQIDVAAGDVIETLGDDADDFYGTQGRLLQAQTVLADGTVTSTHMVPTGEVTKDLGGCMVSYTPVSYDGQSGEVTLSVSVADDTDCEGVTLTLAGYELPGDDTTFVREHANGQELVDYETVTLDAGDSGTVTIDLTDDESAEN